MNRSGGDWICECGEKNTHWDKECFSCEAGRPKVNNDPVCCQLPEPSFRLHWDSSRAAYYVSKPNIADTDVYTADQMRNYANANTELLRRMYRNCCKELALAVKEIISLRRPS